MVISTFDATTILEELAEAEKEQPTAGLILLGTNLNAEEINRIQQEYPKIVVLDTHHPHISANFVSINNFSVDIKQLTTFTTSTYKNWLCDGGTTH